jgi:hypothetical protein
MYSSWILKEVVEAKPLIPFRMIGVKDEMPEMPF